MAKAITYRLKPSLDTELKRLADMAGKSKSAFLSELIAAATTSQLEGVNAEPRLPRSFSWDKETADKLGALARNLGVSRPDVCELLIQNEAERFRRH